MRQLRTSRIMIFIYVSFTCKISTIVSRDQGHGLTYRGLDDQVGIPIEKATVFKVTGKILNSN